MSTVGSYGVAFAFERGTPVWLRFVTASPLSAPTVTWLDRICENSERVSKKTRGGSCGVTSKRSRTPLRPEAQKGRDPGAVNFEPMASVNQAKCLEQGMGRM